MVIQLQEIELQFQHKVILLQSEQVVLHHQVLHQAQVEVDQLQLFHQFHPQVVEEVVLMTLVLMADQVVVDQDHTLVDREIHLLLLHLKVQLVVLVVDNGIQEETLVVAEAELAV